jgi:hypothetical protein
MFPPQKRAVNPVDSLRILTDPTGAMGAGNQERAMLREAQAALPYTDKYRDRTMQMDVDRSNRETDIRSRADLTRDIAFDDQLASDYDAEYRAPDRQAVQLRMGDTESEAKAARQFMSHAQALYDRTRAGRREDLQTQYLDPALIRADSDLGVADRVGASRIQAAEITSGASAEATQQAAAVRGLLSRMAENDPRIIALFDQLFPRGGQQPQP